MSATCLPTPPSGLRQLLDREDAGDHVAEGMGEHDNRSRIEVSDDAGHVVRETP